MAFWNKGEDPWDVKPKPVSVPNPDCDGEPDTLLDSLKAWNKERKAEKVKRETPLPPMVCPWCGKEMETGYIMGQGIWWAPGRPDALSKWAGASGVMGAVQVDTEGGMFPYRTAWVCRDCGKMALNLPDIPDMPEGRTQREYEDELRTYAEQANNREGEN